ncbi:hypothetical protein V1511DRAFT_359632 [Dipodascopsis uninucleata]
MGAAKEQFESRQCNGRAKSTGERCKILVRLPESVAKQTKDVFCRYHTINHSDESARKPLIEIPSNRQSSRRTNQAPKQEVVSKADSEKAAYSSDRKKERGSSFWKRLFCLCADEYSSKNIQRANPSRSSNGSKSVITSNPLKTSKQQLNANVIYPIVSPAVRSKNLALLRAEMEKKKFQADEPGFIYIYEHMVTNNESGNLRSSQSSIILLKIGRSKDVAKRMHQWTSQCSHPVTMTGHFPPLVTSSEEKQVRCKAVHLAERLIHLELRSIFPSSADFAGILPNEDPKSRQCLACGRRHLEWFAIRKLDLHIVLRIIAKWINFVGLEED